LAGGCRPAATEAPAEVSLGGGILSPARVFRFDLQVEVPVAPAQAYAMFTAEIGRWWDHHYAPEEPVALLLEPTPGGAFYEVIDRRGAAAEHARVITAIPGELLRFVGPMGLAGEAVEMVHTLRFAAMEGDDAGRTRVSLEVRGLGDIDSDEARVVEAVWAHFLDEAYRPYVEGRAAAAGAEAAEAPATAASVSLYRQAPMPGPRGLGRGYYSHIDRGRARNYHHADDFRLASDATIRAIRWWGAAEVGEGGGEGAPNIRDYTLRILGADAEGGPGPVLYEQTIAAEATMPTPTGRRGRGAQRAHGEEHVHTVDLARALELDGETTYFLAILAHRSDPAGDTWQWSDAEARNRRSFSRPVDAVVWQDLIDADSAFELLGVTR
ncbi:MAG: hypothetical protein KC486_34920, partial [Myxococcales bacterium]|nr:hypothetical protein [Myxococcales bacterium]